MGLSSRLLGLSFLFLALSAHGELRPRHWVLLGETLHAMRVAVESAETGDSPTEARVMSLAEDVETLTRRPEEMHRLIDFLVGPGRTEAGPILRDFEVLFLASSIERSVPLLERLHFPELRAALGFGIPGPGREYLLSRVAHERARLERVVGPVEAIAIAQNRLYNGAQFLEHSAFFLTILAGLGVGYGAFYGADYVGLRNIPMGRVAAAIGAGISTTVGLFNTFWPWVQESASKIFLRFRYWRLLRTYKDLLATDYVMGIPRVVAMAIPSGAVIQAQEDAALDALIADSRQRRQSTEFLFAVGAAHLEKDFVGRADKIFRHVEEHDGGGELGQLATAARHAIAAHADFKTVLGKLKRTFITRRLWQGSAVFAAVLAAVCVAHPDGLTFFQALVLHGIGFAGLRQLLMRLWPGYPRERLEAEMAAPMTELENSLALMVERARNASGAVDLRRSSINMLVALARSAGTGEAGDLLRKTARQALNRFHDDLALAFLILDAHRQILNQSITQRERATTMHSTVRNTITHEVACLERIAQMGTEDPGDAQAEG